LNCSLSTRGDSVYRRRYASPATTENTPGSSTSFTVESAYRNSIISVYASTLTAGVSCLRTSMTQDEHYASNLRRLSLFVFITRIP
ncbi:hypothetical protein J6590_105597, partial [Homalodisca vitripennis]